MPLIHDDKKPILLVPDNGPVTALSAIRSLDWLLLPGIPVKITDQVAEEATRNQDLPWTKDTCEWIIRNVLAGRVKIAYTDVGFDRRQQFDAWLAGGMDPATAPRARNLGEASILELMRTLEEELRGDNKAIVLIDERRARKALRTVNANLDLVTTRAFFKVLATDYGLNDTAAYWRLVLQVVDNMDTVDEIEQVRFQLGVG